MESIDGIKYPDADEDLLKDRKLGDMYRKFLKGQMADENSDFIDAVRKKYDPKKQYPLYLKKGARKQINVGYKLLNKAEELGEAKNWKSPEWKGLLDDCRREINSLLDSNFGHMFYASEEFKTYHARVLRKAIKIPAKLRQELAMDDDELLAETVALFMSDKVKGTKAARTLVQKKKTSRSPKEIAKAIGRFFKIK